MPHLFKIHGYIPDLPDVRDYSPQHPTIAPLLAKLNIPQDDALLPAAVDLRPGFPPCFDQLQLGSCTSNAEAGKMVYMEQKAYGTRINPSRLFLYKVARELQGFTGDQGSTIRGMTGAAVLFGAPPETFMPYTDGPGWDNEPTPFQYALAANWKDLKYYRLDTDTGTGAQALTNLKKQLAAGIPASFGFTVYSSIGLAGTTGDIPFPTSRDTVDGGHAVVACGYDNNYQVAGAPTKGAIWLRNSWGKWGPFNGYLRMPFDYFLQGLACDIWATISQGYVDCGQFGFTV